jgi:hypothetical protein
MIVQPDITSCDRLRLVMRILQKMTENLSKTEDDMIAYIKDDSEELPQAASRQLSNQPYFLILSAKLNESDEPCHS